MIFEKFSPKNAKVRFFLKKLPWYQGCRGTGPTVGTGTAGFGTGTDTEQQKCPELVGTQNRNKNSLKIEKFLKNQKIRHYEFSNVNLRKRNYE